MYLFGEKNKTGKPLSPLLPETLSFELRHRPKNHKDFKDLKRFQNPQITSKDLKKDLDRPLKTLKRPRKTSKEF